MKHLARLGAVLAIVGCASTSATTTRTAANVATDATPAPPPPPDAAGFHRVRHGSWSVSVPTNWVAEETRDGVAFHSEEGGPNRLVVGHFPNENQPREAMIREIAEGYRARNLRVSGTREGQTQGHDYIDITVDASEHEVVTRMVGYATVSGNRFAWALCGARADQWNTLGPGCTATLDTLRIASPTARATAPAGRQLLGRDGISVAVPATWRVREGQNDATWQLQSSEQGNDNDPLQVVITGGTLGVPANELVQRLSESLRGDGMEVRDRTTRRVGNAQVDVLTFESAQTAPVGLLQRVIFAGPSIVVLTCGVDMTTNTLDAACRPLVEGFRAD